MSNRGITDAIAAGQLTIDPYEPDLVQLASVDVRLHRFFRPFAAGDMIDPGVDSADACPLIEIIDGGFVLPPRGFVLASTLERIKVGNGYAARVEGKSSLGRLGLRIHSTAGFIDPGFEGHVTLELSNDNVRSVRLVPGMLIGQLCLFRLDAPVPDGYGADRYGSHYQGQAGPPTPSRSWQGWRTWSTWAEEVTSTT